MEEAGYIARAMAYNDTGSLALYLLQSIFLLLPPILFAATLYMVYSRVVHALRAEHRSPVPMRWATHIFVIGDLTCLNIQSTGAGLLGKPKTDAIGTWIVVAGLICQVLMFMAFVACCAVFHRRHARDLAAGRAALDPATAAVPWRAHLRVLYAASMAVLARNLYRTVEFATGQGSGGFLTTHEWPMYVFDAGLMVGVMAVFFCWYPSSLYPAARDRMRELELARKEKRELELAQRRNGGGGGDDLLAGRRQGARGKHATSGGGTSMELKLLPGPGAVGEAHGGGTAV